jgi:hypothetical protein
MDLFLTIGLKIIKIWHILGKLQKKLKKNLDFPFITSQSYEYKKYDIKILMELLKIWLIMKHILMKDLIRKNIY